jgi:hypothetical protein
MAEWNRLNIVLLLAFHSHSYFAFLILRDCCIVGFVRYKRAFYQLSIDNNFSNKNSVAEEFDSTALAQTISTWSLSYPSSATPDTVIKKNVRGNPEKGSPELYISKIFQNTRLPDNKFIGYI